MYKFLVFIFNLIFKNPNFGRYSISHKTEDYIKRDWASIDLAIKTKNPAQLRQALITADRSLDSALKDLSKGESMGERLKNSKDQFNRDTYSKVWEAHKVRNNMVHEAGYEPPYYVVIDSIENLRMALRSLKVRI